MLTSPLQVIDAHTLAYQPAWDQQLALHEQVHNGTNPAGFLMLVEHPPVVTIGRRPGAERHLLAPTDLLLSRGVEVIQTDRGGDITFHGPGQLVAYPILDLNHYRLNLHAYMRLLEEAVIATLRRYGLEGVRSQGATGVWVHDPAAASPDGLAKICAMGVKLRRWITLHGLALNVTTDLAYFDLINPCGLSRPVTSMHKLLGPGCPSMAAVKTTLAEEIQHQLNAPRPGPEERKERESS